MKNYSGLVLENNAPIAGTLAVPISGYSQKFNFPNDYARGKEIVPNLTGFQLFVESELEEVAVEWSIEHTFNRRNEMQQIHLNSLPNNKSYRLSFLGQITESIAYADSGEDLQEKLGALSTIQGNVEVSDRSITFVGPLAKTNVDMLKVVEISGYSIKNEWSATEAYLANDVVTRLGENYLAIQGSTNQDPLNDNGTYWQKTISVTEAIPAYQWRSVASGSQTISFMGQSGKGWLDFELEAEVKSELIAEDWRINFQVSGAKICFSSYQEDKGALTKPNEENVVALNEKVSSIYRVLGATLDEGIDALGNGYRAAVKEYKSSNALYKDDSIWLSKPNPSKFAVESLYFDVRKDGEASVVNKVLIDPVTPGMFCNIYYTNENLDEDFDMLLWVPALSNLKLNNKYTFNFPTPITAKYIKLEFTQLQGRSYIVGDYQPRVTYKKHPKWVLDYFYNVYIQEKNRELPSDQVTVKYDSLDLYYNYFIDDIVESSILPSLDQKSITTNVINDYLAAATQEENQSLDPETLRNIKTNINASYYLNPLLASRYSGRGNVISNVYQVEDYSTERVTKPTSDVDLVSTSDRESVQMDRSFPTMSFYVTSRHAYKISKAKFENDKAYFAGIKQVSFQRDYYASWTDQLVYSETAGDETNLEFNDLQLQDGVWTGKGSG